MLWTNSKYIKTKPKKQKPLQCRLARTHLSAKVMGVLPVDFAFLQTVI